MVVSRKKNMNIQCKINEPISSEQFVGLLKKSTLGERRPIDNSACMKGVVKNSNLIITAWDGAKLIGVARSVTDYHYACYLSDLAVDKEYQRSGVGKQLLALTQEQLYKECKLILIAAPDANSYYEYLGFSNNPRCWVLDREQSIIS